MPPAPVQSKHGIATSGSQIVLTFDSATTPGNLVGYAIWVFEGATTISSVSDGGSNTHIDPADHPVTSAGYQMFDRYFQVETGGTTITVNLSATTALSYIIAQEISGCATSSALDVHDGNAQDFPVDTATDGVTSTAQTTTVNGDYILGIELRVNGGVLTEGTNFTNDYVGGEPLMIEHYVQPSAGSIAATWTIDNNNIASTAIMMAFKPLSGSPATVTWVGYIG